VRVDNCATSIISQRGIETGERIFERSRTNGGVPAADLKRTRGLLHHDNRRTATGRVVAPGNGGK